MTEKTKTLDQITILVMKDNFSSKAFKISMRWITRSILILSSLILSSILSLFVAFKYFEASKVKSQKLNELEHTLATLETSNGLKKILETTLSGPHKAESPALAEGTHPPLSISSTDHSISVTPRASPESVKNAPLAILGPKVYWNREKLSFQFTIQYTAKDQGHQQGRIIVLARGKAVLMAYPGLIFNKAGSERLLRSDLGEFFSVSRFRNVHADFYPVPNKNLIDEFEILLFDSNSKLILYQDVKAEIAGTLPITPSPAVILPIPQDSAEKTEPLEQAKDRQP